MIRAENLRIAFDGREVISDFSLTVEQGETVALLGKNGAGKTVLLKAIAGLINTASGSVAADGRVAYVFQKGGLFDSMDVFDNTAFGLARMKLNEEEIRRRVEAALERVDLKGSEHKLPSELSGGMQKRAGIARAVCMEPNIILYDDPTAGLDPVLSDSMADLILEIRDSLNAASIVVTHDLSVAAKTSDRIVLLYRGSAVFSGTKEDFFSETDPFAKQFIRGDIEGPIDIF